MVKCTVVTVVMNNVSQIGRCIDSVLTQTYQNVEHVIIDGGSTDGTLELLKSRIKDISVLVSEPDSGISDAFNKGIKAASGDLIWLIGSDDVLPQGAMALAVKEWRAANQPGVLFGAVLFVDEKTGAEIREVPDQSKLSKYMSVYHPATLVRKEVYERIGGYDLGYDLAMDCEWVHRALSSGVSAHESHEIFTRISLGGVSDKLFLKALSEYRQSALKYGYNALVVNFYFLQQVVFKTLMSVRLLRTLKHRLHKS